MKAVSIDGETLNLEDIELVAVDNATVALAHGCLEKIKQSRQTVEAAIQKEVIAYGINTGFGKFKDQIISPENIEKLQENLVVSHACGTGPLFDQSTVRAMVLLRANALAKGFSGIRPELIELLIALLNNQIHPLVPEQGSVGASGDLSPLSHIALSLIGQGQCHFQGKTVDSLKALEACGLMPVKLMAKEGLALTNGTQTMSAVLSLTLLEAERLAKIADIVAAMSIEALMGSKKPFLPSVQTVRPHPGQQACAHNLLRLLKDSTIMDAHIDCNQVQDSYSLRCIPQVHGASRQAFKHVREVVSIEINSATDNPLIFSDDETDNQIVSAGNFHGQPLALAGDYLSIAIAELANISERRIERLVNPSLSNGLPAFLTEFGGLNSGLMIPQYTAAALVSENKSLAHPASVDSIPTSANQEDHVSMGTISVRKARQILNNSRKVLSIELLCAAQAIDLRIKKEALDHKTQLSPSPVIAKIIHMLRQSIAHLSEDRYLYPDMTKAEEILKSGELLNLAEETIGKLL